MNKGLVFFIPSIEEGGVEKNLYIIANYFSKKKIDLSILTCNFNKKKKFYKKIKFIGPKHPYFYTKNRIIKTFICSIYLFFYLLKNNSKTLVFTFQSNLFSIIISKIMFTKIIARANSAPAGWTKNIFKKFFYKVIINLADDVLVNSKDFKTSFYKFFKIKTECIYNPFDKSIIFRNIKKNQSTFKKKKSLKIISIGRLTDQKDHLTLLKASKLINKKCNPEIIILGKGNNYKNLRNYIFENNLERNVKLLGYQKNPYVFLKSADILVLTSKYEGLPNVLLEAQFLKKYVISTNCPTGPKEILMNGKAGDLIRIGDYKTLAKLINNYKNKKKLISKKINFGIKNFYKYDLNLNCEKYFKLVKRNF